MTANLKDIETSVIALRDAGAKIVKIQLISVDINSLTLEFGVIPRAGTHPSILKTNRLSAYIVNVLTPMLIDATDCKVMRVDYE
jgi:hypothetical protein